MAADEPTVATVVNAENGDTSRSLEGTFVLSVVEGPDKGKSIILDAAQASRVLVGTGPACELRLNDPKVSRRHATVEVTPAAIRVMDVGSTNGTFMDRVKVLDAEFRGGELLRVGATVLTIEPEKQHQRGASAASAASLPAIDHFGRVLGESREMRRLYARCLRIAEAPVPVIIEGETGTGKEVLAEAIHEHSGRSRGPFVVFDCTTIAPNLLESELFGHERGAFTGAVGLRKGVFEQADGGTLLIDEIGDLDLSLQPKLLRAIERSEIRRVGGDKWFRVDVRVIAATRRDLDREVALDRFRDDLFHRLAVARIELPPLRRRRGDVTFLARRFWADMGGDGGSSSSSSSTNSNSGDDSDRTMIPADVLARWEEHPWPGNVRELRNAVARQLSLGELGSYEATDWGEPSSPLTSAGAATPPQPTDDSIDQVLAQNLPFYQAREQIRALFEQRYVEHLLERHDGDIGRAVAASGIGRRYLQVLRAKHRS